MTVQELINKLIVLDLEKEVYVQDNLDGVIGTFNIDENEKDIVFNYDGEWVRRV